MGKNKVQPQQLKDDLDITSVEECIQNHIFFL